MLYLLLFHGDSGCMNAP